MRYLLLSLLLVLGLSASSQAPDYVPTDGLSAWYDFNANLIDGSGNSNDAQSHGATFGPDRWGNELFAVDFTGPEQWVETSPWLTGIQNNFTLSIWFNLRSYEAQDGPSANIVHHRAHWKDKSLTTGVHPSTGQSLGESIMYADRQFSGTNYLNLYSQSIELNVWNHVVVSGDNSNFFLYVNGELIDQAPRTFDSDWSGSFYGAYLGANGYQSESTMNGMVDEFGAWSRTLSILEIQGLFAAGELVFGCIDEQACNFNPEANVGDDSCIPSGCMDIEACNFNAEAECEGEACDYTCCPGPGCCSIGHYWDWDMEKCFDIVPSDTDFDGCVSMTDLLDLLSAFGTCVEEDPEVVEWSCGDPLEYQGYVYETVQIGDQCWFAENLRSENYEDGDEIPAGLDDEEWSSTTSGAMAVYGEGSNSCNTQSPDGDACDPNWSLAEYGRLYNWYAVNDMRGLCPSGWHVPSDDEWTTMEVSLGMNPEDANATGWRGTNQGAQLKATSGWLDGGNGSNVSGFSATPGGNRDYWGAYYHAGTTATFWTGTIDQSASWARRIELDERINRYTSSHPNGWSVRCLKDSE